MAYIQLSTGSSLTAMVVGLDSSYSFADRKCTWYVNDMFKGEVMLPAHAYSGGHCVLLSMGNDTPYKVRCVIQADSWSYSVDVKLVQWVWTFSNGICTARESQNAYTALTNKGRTGNFSCNVWNNLVYKAKELLDYKSMNWSPAYCSYWEANMEGNDRVLTAVRYNSLVYQINRMIDDVGIGGSHLAYVQKGDTVYGSLLTTLATRINQCMT